MRFADVLGHDALKASLVHQYREGKLPHAMMFAGPPGNGKLPLAIALAQYLHCQEPGQEDACGKCSSCIKMGKLTHPDLHFSFPTVAPKGSKENLSSRWLEEWRKANAEIPYMHYVDWMSRIVDENKRGNISAAETHQILQKLSLVTYESHAKVMIIWMAEFLESEANRLLKLLEEPPEGTYIILIADRPGDVLGTILSRCQLVRVGMIEDEAIARGLVQEFGMEPNEAANVAPVAEGDYMAARRLATHESTGIIQDFIEWMRICFKVEAGPMLAWIDKIGQRGREAHRQFLLGAQFLLREALHLQYHPGHVSRLDQEEIDSLRKFSQYLQFHQMVRLQEQLEQDYHLIVRNGNPKVIFMASSLSAHQILKERV